MPAREATKAETAWMRDFGRAYTDRNLLSVDAQDALYRDRYGVTRTDLNRRFVGDLPPSVGFLEVGSNCGNQLACLANMGFERLCGVDLQAYALVVAGRLQRGWRFVQATAQKLPFRLECFDVVFTSALLMHVPPTVLPSVMREIARCTRRFIWGLEPYHPTFQAVHYRGHDDLMWQGPFANLYVKTVPTFRVVSTTMLPYVQDGSKMDMMFLLEKREEPPQLIERC